MKNKLVFAALVLAALTWVTAPAKAACDPSYQTLIYTEQGGASMHACSGANVIIEAGATLTLASTSSLVQTNVDYTGKSLTATFGIVGATAAISGAANVGSLVSAGAISGTTGALSSTLDVTGNEYHGAALYRSTFTAASGAQAWTGALTSAANISGASVTASNGPFNLKNKTLSELMALSPAAEGEAYWCTTGCTPHEIAVSTGIGAPNTGGFGNAAGAQLN